MKNIIPEIYISAKAYKTPKGYTTPFDALLPLSNIEITDLTLRGEGDKIILKYDNFLIPITRKNFKELLLTTTTSNSIINESCAIIEEDTSLYVINYSSQEYNDLRLVYEDSLNQTFIKRKDVEIGDLITFKKGKIKVTDFIYLGEFFVAPFDLLNNRMEDIEKDDGFIKRKGFCYFFNNPMHRFLFAKVENNQITDYHLLGSFPKILSAETTYLNIKGLDIEKQMKNLFENVFISYIKSQHNYFEHDDYKYYLNTDNEINMDVPLNQYVSQIKQKQVLTLYKEQPSKEEVIKELEERLNDLSKKEKVIPPKNYFARRSIEPSLS